MRDLEQETNIEVLREFSGILLKTVDRLQSSVIELTRQNGELSGKETPEPASQQWLTTEIQDQLTRLQKKFFGCGREGLPGKPARPVGHEKQQVLALTERPHEPEAPAPRAGTERAAALGKDTESKAHDFLTPDLVAESLTRGLPMSAGAEAWKKVEGLTEDTVEITITERTYRKVIHKQAKYRLKDEYNESDKEVIITAPGPVKVKPGMTYSVDFALAVAIDKYEFHLPLERQRRKMESVGLTIDVKTLYSMCEAVAEHCHAILPAIRNEIKTDYAAVCLDETPWRILSDQTHGQMWVMSNRLGSYYQFEPTRSGAIAEEMLKGYDGAIITDAFGGYNRLAKKPTIRVQNCLAHARREFFERYDDFPAECHRIITLIDQLFEIEREAKTIEDIRILRQTRSKAVVDELRNYLFETKPRFLPGEGISKAINYCLNHWKQLTHFLTDSTVNLSNNEAERALRHVVVGRKNFLGSQTINGADTAAALYTVMETAKKNSTDPTEYLRYLITERWHKREPMTPKKYADKKLGPSKKIKWPARSEWKIESGQTNE
jgi:transposase